ncbi:MAG: hypothetical protein HYT63_03720 [Candidatus Yanofskybacteria bacterium]|nr:hypothetical protein [Candidatus Yanofskybacteria bacterium]
MPKRGYCIQIKNGVAECAGCGGEVSALTRLKIFKNRFLDIDMFSNQ